MVASGAARLATRSGVARFLSGKPYDQLTGADAQNGTAAQRSPAARPPVLSDYFGHGTEGEAYASTKLMQALVAREADRRANYPESSHTAFNHPDQPAALEQLAGTDKPLVLDQPIAPDRPLASNHPLASNQPAAPDRGRASPVRVLAVTPTTTARTALSRGFVAWAQAAGVLRASDVGSVEEAATAIVATVKDPAGKQPIWGRLLPEWALSECDAMAAWERSARLLLKQRRDKTDSRSAQREAVAEALEAAAAAAVGCASPEDLRFWPHPAPAGLPGTSAPAR
jgi:hypothetical protein